MTNHTTPPKGFGTSIKINTRSPTKYEPLQMCDESVYNLAQHYYTAQEIADRFKVTVSTLMALHGEAFYAGKDEAFNKPRLALKKIIDDFMEVDPVTGFPLHFANKEVPVDRLLKAVELHARKYEGMGTKSEVEVTHKEPVNASSFKFSPLTPDNKDEPWTK